MGSLFFTLIREYLREDFNQPQLEDALDRMIPSYASLSDEYKSELSKAIDVQVTLAHCEDRRRYPTSVLQNYVAKCVG